MCSGVPGGPMTLCPLPIDDPSVLVFLCLIPSLLDKAIEGAIAALNCVCCR